jgi:hypothetical protein
MRPLFGILSLVFAVVVVLLPIPTSDQFAVMDLIRHPTV